MSDRIRLAEAMGWVQSPNPNYWYHPTGCMELLPDPFTDANDDYAVLVWMKNTRCKERVGIWTAFVSALEDFPHLGHKCAYQIGDYARAALKAIDHTESTITAIVESGVLENE